jgi:hypothetical protein
MMRLVTVCLFFIVFVSCEKKEPEPVPETPEAIDTADFRDAFVGTYIGTRETTSDQWSPSWYTALDTMEVEKIDTSASKIVFRMASLGAIVDVYEDGTFDSGGFWLQVYDIELANDTLHTDMWFQGFSSSWVRHRFTGVRQ